MWWMRSNNNNHIKINSTPPCDLLVVINENTCEYFIGIANIIIKEEEETLGLLMIYQLIFGLFILSYCGERTLNFIQFYF